MVISMHELSVTEGLLSIVNEEAKKRGVRKVTSINLVIGELASIIDDSVQFYFDILSKGTVSEGAVLFFHRIAAEYSCLECKNVFEKKEYSYNCPICGGKSVIVNRGQEFYIESIEVDTDED
jgi:hydrogenase nickel incorporation protein HypA/HybF